MVDDPDACRQTAAPRNDQLESYMRRVTIGEIEHVPIVLADYDADWPRCFEEHRRRIAAALGSRAQQIEHIGSTAVPGLCAKPIIDVLLVVAEPADESSYVPDLVGAGYQLRIREPEFFEHRMLRTPDRDAHVHVFGPGSPEIERYLLFRDRLREEPAERELYARTKRELAGRDWPSMQHYAEAKSEAVESILSRAGWKQPT